MSDVVNRTTLQYRRSVNEPDFPTIDWLHIVPGSANATIIATVPERYWLLTGDVLSEMSAAEKIVKDQQILDTTRDDVVTILDDSESLESGLLVDLVDRINDIAANLESLRADIRASNNFTQLHAAMDGITSVPQTTKAAERANIRANLGNP